MNESTRKARILAHLVTRDEAGRHFTERYSEEDLDLLETEGLIRIERPVHKTGIPYGREHWSVELTEEGSCLAENWWKGDGRNDLRPHLFDGQ